MYNVFSLSDVERCGIHRQQIRRAVGCCIDQLGTGVYVLRRECSRNSHRELRYRITHAALVQPPAEFESSAPGDWWERDLTDHLGLLSAVKILPGDVVSHRSAARVWGLPLLLKSANKIEVSHPERRRTGKLIQRRRSPVPPDSIAKDADSKQAFGDRWTDAVCSKDLHHNVTNLERTVVDVCCDCALQEAVMVADAYIGGVLDPPVLPGAEPLRRRESSQRLGAFTSDGLLAAFPLSGDERAARRRRLIEAAAEVPKFRGRRQFDKVMVVCNGLSESPAESLANLGFFELDIPVEQQFRVDDEQGLVGYADFRVKGTNLLFEVDGRGKYRDRIEAAQADMTRLLAEKDRTDRLHRCGYLTERGGYLDVAKPERFAPLIWRAVRAARTVDSSS